MALMDIVQPAPKQKKGGGLLGSALGTVAGGVIGAFAGNPIAGAKLGGSVGGMAGNAIKKPGVQGGGQGIGLSRLADDPGVQMAQLTDAKKALDSVAAPIEEKEQFLNDVLNPAQMKLQEQLNRMRG